MISHFIKYRKPDIKSLDNILSGKLLVLEKTQESFTAHLSFLCFTLSFVTKPFTSCCPRWHIPSPRLSCLSGRRKGMALFSHCSVHWRDPHWSVGSPLMLSPCLVAHWSALPLASCPFPVTLGFANEMPLNKFRMTIPPVFLASALQNFHAISMSAVQYASAMLYVMSLSPS